MSVTRGIQVAITHGAIGIFVGSLIDGLMPGFVDGGSLQSLVVECMVQVGCNGAALAAVSSYLSDDDPTSGIPFSMALFEAQPNLQRRVDALSKQVRQKVSASVPQMASRAVME